MSEKHLGRAKYRNKTKLDKTRMNQIRLTLIITSIIIFSIQIGTQETFGETQREVNIAT